MQEIHEFACYSVRAWELSLDDHDTILGEVLTAQPMQLDLLLAHEHGSLRMSAVGYGQVPTDPHGCC
ncbi:hypothetical protein LIA77_09609 [Sarocladium implicatum]|nr:hypothetical protein LIA77_09609 [Sarocladium implicatum]